jgi:hypothetical protein
MLTQPVITTKRRRYSIVNTSGGWITRDDMLGAYLQPVLPYEAAIEMRDLAELAWDLDRQRYRQQEWAMGDRR